MGGAGGGFDLPGVGREGGVTWGREAGEFCLLKVMELVGPLEVGEGMEGGPPNRGGGPERPLAGDAFCPN